MSTTTNAPPDPVRPADTSLDLDAIRARLYERERPVISPWTLQQRLLWSEPLDEQIRADVRDLMAEVERFHRAETWLLHNLHDSVKLVYQEHLRNGRFDHD